jgi:hypothetical protein
MAVNHRGRNYDVIGQPIVHQAVKGVRLNRHHNAAAADDHRIAIGQLRGDASNPRFLRQVRVNDVNGFNVQPSRQQTAVLPKIQRPKTPAKIKIGENLNAIFNRLFRAGGAGQAPH